MNSNPLSQYFRQPAIYIRLPSQGRFYPQGAMDLPANEELPVLPMTTLDEITYRTPDALFNGSAVATVIQSCLPNIKDAWAIPAMDIDTILVAIRIATYGHEMDMETQCPACSEDANFGLDLRRILDRISAPDYQSTMRHGDLEIFFRPMSYQDLNASNLAQFEEQKAMQILENQEITEEQKAQQMGDVLKKLTEVTLKALARSIAAVRTPQANVSDPEHIAEWLANCDRNLFGKIRTHIIETKQKGEIPPLDLECPSCHHKYQQVFTMNMTNFFADAS
jgi:hypothetical protein